MPDTMVTCDRSDHLHDSLDEARRCAAHEENPVSCALTGEDGNAMAIMGRVSRALKNAGVPKAQRDAYMTAAMAGDYDALLATSMKTLDDHGIEWS